MVNVNNNFNVIPWYSSLEQQNHRKWYAFDKQWPLIMSNTRFLPFQFVLETTPTNISAITVYSEDKSITRNLGIAPIAVPNAEKGYCVVMLHPEICDFTAALPEGRYYATLTIDGETLYSEVFTVVGNISSYLKLTYWNTDTLYYKNGEINYANDFRYEMYLDTTIGKPEYEFSEELTTRLGYKFLESQISNKLYKFVFLGPEFICDAMRLIRLSDYIKLESGRDSYNAISFSYEPSWETQGDLASIEVSFETDTIIQKLPSFNRNQRENFYNALLSSASEPLLYDEGVVAQYYTAFSDAITGKLTRQLAEADVEEITEETVIPIDQGLGAAQQVKLLPLLRRYAVAAVGDYPDLESTLSQHVANRNIHITSEERKAWNALRDFWYVDENGNLHTTYSIVVEGGGAFGKGQESEDTPSEANIAIKIDGRDTLYKPVDGIITIPAYPEDTGLNESELEKYLTTNQYAKLSDIPSLDGYALASDLSTLRTDFDNLNTLLNGNVGGVIDTWNEVVSFLDGYKDSEDLATILSGMNTDIANRVLIEDFEKLEEAVNPLFGYFDANGNANNALKLDGHSADYFATADALNTHITAFNTYKTTTDDRLNKLEDLWYMDKEGNVHTTHNIVVEKGGAFGKGSGGGGDVPSGGGIDEAQLWNILGQSGTQTIHSSHIPDLSEKYLSTSGGVITGKGYDILTINRTDNRPTLAFAYNGTTVGYLGMTTGGVPMYVSSVGDAYSLYHSGNFNPADYLPKSGGFISSLGWRNQLNILRAEAGDSVIGFFNQNTDNYLGAIGFDNDSNLIVNVKNVGNANILHSGNIGSYKAGDSYKLGGITSDGFVQFKNDSASIFGAFTNIPIIKTSYIPTQGGDNCLIQLPLWSNNVSSTYYTAEIRTILNGTPSFRTVQNGTATDWRNFAFTDSNVASATKLQTARSIWGQSFDGRADVSGNIKLRNDGSDADIGNAYSASDSTMYNRIKIGAGTTGLEYYAGAYSGINSSLVHKFYVSYQNINALSIANNGNVLIGSIRDYGYKVQAEGGICAYSYNGDEGTLGTRIAGASFFGPYDYGLQLWVRGTGHTHIQSGRADNNAIAYNINLQPLGGNVLIGTTDDNGSGAKLQVAGPTYISGKHLNIGKSIAAYNSLRTEISLINDNTEPSMMILGSNGGRTWGVESRGSSDNYRFGIYSWLGGVHTLGIATNGNITISSNSVVDQGYKLYVDGNTYVNGIIHTPSWLYTYNSCGWYNATYEAGMYAEDYTYVKSYGGKPFFTTGFKAGYNYDNDNRAKIDLFSTTDHPCDLYLGSNNARQWSINVRASNEGHWLGFYNPTYLQQVLKLYQAGGADLIGNLTVTGGGAFGSDIRYKDIVAYQQLDLETIVNAPLFTFKWTDREDKVEHLGTSAQYWLGTQFKDAVNTTNKDFFHLDYGALAVGIGISVAREVKGVKTEVQLLREKVNQLEQELAQYRRS